MAIDQSAANDNPEPATRPPFNEVSVLFPLLTFYTVGYLALMTVDFLLKGVVDLPEGIMPVYIALLGAYAADKEIRRWVGTPEPPRKGSFFVYLWLLFFLAAYIIRSFQPDYVLPNNLLAVCLQVLGIFFGSRASKYAWEGRSRTANDSELPERGEQVLELIRAKGRITNREVAEALQVSAASAKRILADLADRGEIRLMGEKRGAYYIRATDEPQRSEIRSHDHSHP